MAVDHDRDAQRLAEVVEDDGGCPGIGGPVAGGHGAGLVQQQAHRHLRRLDGQSVLGENLPIAAEECVGVQAAPHKEARLFAATLLVTQLPEQALLQLLGDGQQGAGDGVVLGDHFRRNFRHTVHPDGHPLVDVPVGDALGLSVQFGQTILFQLLTDGFLRHGVQEPLHFRLHSVREFRKVVLVDFHTAAQGFRHLVSLHQGHAALFFWGDLLLSRSGFGGNTCCGELFTTVFIFSRWISICQGVGLLTLLRLGKRRFVRLI